MNARACPAKVDGDSRGAAEYIKLADGILRIVGQIPGARHDPGQAEFLRSSDMRRTAECRGVAASAGAAVAQRGSARAGVCIVCRRRTGAKPPVKIAGDFDKVKMLRARRRGAAHADGHPDLSGRYYPNHAGRMLQGAYRIPEPIMRQYDPAKTPQENPVFRPDAVEKYLHPTPYGSCPPGGTPTSITTQATEHGPLEIVQVPGRVWLLTEFPQTIRMIPTDGRQHSADPDTSFNGESVGPLGGRHARRRHGRDRHADAEYLGR